jgi:hypothetical protein
VASRGSEHPRFSAFLVAVIVGFAFGGADQYLGSLRLLVLFGEWPSTVSQMSAPWLVLPFAFGLTQVSSGRAMRLGLVATQSALAGYFVLTLSPLEGVSPGTFPSSLVSLVVSGQNGIYIAAGAVTGTLYGLLGQRWRVDRSWISVVLVTGALCLEPVARQAVGRLSAPTVVWTAEVAIGAALALAYVIATVTHRRTNS